MWVALVSSALLHLLVMLLVLGILRRERSEGAPAFQPAAPIEISLFETEDRSAAETRAVPSPPPSVPGPRQDRPRPVAGPVAPRAAPPSDKAATSGDTTVAEVVAPSSRSAAPPSPAPPAKPDLSFDGLAAAEKQRVAAIPNAQEDLERLLVPAPEPTGKGRTLSEALASAERHADAARNVRLGRAHPLLVDYLRHARDHIVAEADRLGDQLTLGAQETAGGWARGYLDRLREIHRNGPNDRPATDAPLGGPHSDVLAAMNEAQAQAAASAVRRVAHVCVGVAPNHPVVVTLRRSSGNERLDRIAVSSFESATAARPVASDVRPGLACYLVGVSAYRMPPLPALGLGWKNGRPEIIHPLKRIDSVTVELESVDFGPPPGRPSLLRRSN